MSGRRVVDWDSALGCQVLGNWPDAVIAKAWGLTKQAVCNARQARGVPAYAPGRLLTELETLILAQQHDDAWANSRATDDTRWAARVGYANEYRRPPTPYDVLTSFGLDTKARNRLNLAKALYTLAESEDPLVVARWYFDRDLRPAQRRQVHDLLRWCLVTSAASYPTMCQCAMSYGPLTFGRVSQDLAKGTNNHGHDTYRALQRAMREVL